MADKELIYREDLIAEYDKVHIGAAGGARKLMVDAPAIDAVEVVRCKECKYFSSFEYSEQQGLCINHSGLNGIDACVSEDDFCSYGERKADNDN